MSVHIVDDEQRRDRPQPACGWPFGPVPFRVPAARGHLLRYRSSTMCTDIACVAVPRIYPRGARGGPLYFHHGLLGSGRVGYFEDIRLMVSRIPRGKVSTYGDVARAAGHPGTARQVAWALRDAGAAGIPWQRVLGRGGKILLPGESGLHQKLLLEIEGVQFAGNRVLMECHGHRFPDTCLGGMRRKAVKDQGRRPNT